MKKLTFTLIAIALIFLFIYGKTDTKKEPNLVDLTGYVNPMIGTDKEGNVFPGA